MLPNVFLTIKTDPVQEEFQRRLHATRRKHGFKGTATAADRLHISLHSLDRPGLPASPATIAAVCDAASRIRFPFFEVTFTRALSFRNRQYSKPYVITGGIELDMLREFHAEIGRVLSQHTNLEFSGKFTPHITLFWDPQMIEAHEVAPIGWLVTEFLLIRSHVGLSRHEVLGRWELG